jgi:zinc protease
VKAQDRAELVETYQSVSALAQRLGALAILGLDPNHDAQASRARQQTPKAELDKLSAVVAPGQATIVVVGPAAAVTPQLAAAGLGPAERWDPEGFPLPPGKK